MKRNAMKDFEAWEASPVRKPLLVYGARQTGKTTLLGMFAKERFPDDYVRFDLERDSRARRAFEDDLKPEELLRRLEQVSGRRVDPDHTLVILDEVQASNRALASLKYFQEEMPQLRVVAAGSLLGIAVRQQGYSAPVGKVHTLTLHPMGFDEFLEATGEGALVDDIRRCYESSEPFWLHDEMMERFWTYLLVGGMPEAVASYARDGDLAAVLALQQDILDLYTADMSKYATPAETARIRAVWNSVPAQLAKENRKFQYKLVRSGGRASVYASALDWLMASGLTVRCTQITSGQSPIALHENPDSFKAYMADTGLLCARSGLDAHTLLSAENRRLLDLGGVVENYVAQSLTTNDIPLCYWISGGTAEVDFVIEPSGMTAGVPVEVKSSGNTRSRSLSVYRGKYRPDRALRLSTKNFGYDNGIRSVPLYAAFCIRR